MNGDTAWIYSAPLEVYFQKKGARTIGETDFSKIEGSTALWRSYMATWQIENDSLFLVRLQTDFIPEWSRDIDLKGEFGTDRVFARWVTDTIVSHHGAVLGDLVLWLIYETEKRHTFIQGKRIDTKVRNFIETNFVERDITIFPGLSFLHETIRRTIVQSISASDRHRFNTNESVNLTIAFNSDREISYIGFWREPRNSNEELLRHFAREALRDFPRLMRVNHENYRPPHISLFFSGHCLRHPR